MESSQLTTSLNRCFKPESHRLVFWYDPEHEFEETLSALDIGRGIPQKMTLTDGKGDERTQANRLVSPGQTGVYDRGYQSYNHFDDWQTQDRHFVCRIKASSRKTVIRANDVNPDSHIFYDAVVLLGTKDINQTEREVRVVGYHVDGVAYWVATDRFDLTAEQITLIYCINCAGRLNRFLLGGNAT